jgi:ATP-dependent Clp protease protease subunit
MDLTNTDPRLIARALEYGPAAPPAQAPAADHRPGLYWGAGPSTGIPQRGPVAMPMAAPGPGGGYNRYREMTLEEMLLENRVVFLVGEINHVSASRVIMQMLYLQSVKRDQDINLYINSPGGVVDDTLAIYDIMKFLTCDIATYCIGRAESGGAIVFAAGKKGKRFILPNAKVMVHQPFGGVYGQTADIQIQAEEILKTKNTLISILAKCTGQSFEKIREDSERDRFFDAQQSVAYGLCDEVIGEEATSPTAIAAAEAAADATKPK